MLASTSRYEFQSKSIFAPHFDHAYPKKSLPYVDGTDNTRELK